MTDINTHTNNTTYIYTFQQIKDYFDYCTANSITPTFTAGTYYISTHAHVPIEVAGLDLDLTGVTFKRMNGIIGAGENWRIMLWFRTTGDVEITGGEVDQNEAGQTVSNITAQQHNHGIYIQAAAADLNCKVDGTDIENSIGGGVSLSHHGSGGWDKVEFLNITGTNRPHDLRGDAEITSSYNDLILNDCDMVSFTNEVDSVDSAKAHRVVVNNSDIGNVGLFDCDVMVSDLITESVVEDGAKITWEGGSIDTPHSIEFKNATLEDITITKTGNFPLIRPKQDGVIKLIDCDLADGDTVNFLSYCEVPHSIEFIRCDATLPVFMRAGNLKFVEHTDTVAVEATTITVSGDQVITLVDSPNVSVTATGTADPVVNQV